MRYFYFVIGMILLFQACTKTHSVWVGGRVEGSDSVVSLWVNGKLHKFLLDEQDYFSGEIPLTKPTYGELYPVGVSLFLSPGEDVEINMNFNNSRSIQFSGSLGAINNFIEEQRMELVLRSEEFEVPEEEFVSKMKEEMKDRILLLEAKNLGEKFTEMERERIKYLVAEKTSLYSVWLKQTASDKVPGSVYNEFISSFPIDREDMLEIFCFRNFVLNYISYQEQRRSIRNLISLLQKRVSSSRIKDFVLSATISSYIWQNGLKDSEYLLALARREIADTNKIMRIEKIVERWKRLEPGAAAPNIILESLSGDTLQLKDFRGDFLYLYLWRSWRFVEQEHVAMWELVHKYAGKNIRFLSVALDGSRDYWEQQVKSQDLKGELYLVPRKTSFYGDYMIHSMSRSIFIDPQGRIIDALAPSPVDSVELLFRRVGL